MNFSSNFKYVILNCKTLQFGCPFNTYEEAFKALNWIKNNDLTLKPEKAKLYKIAKIEVNIIQTFDVS